MEAMEIGPDLFEQRGVPPLSTVLESPVFMSSKDICCYVLDICKEWSKRVSPKHASESWFIDELSDTSHGFQVIGQKEIREVLAEWYQDFLIGRTEHERKRVDKYCANNKFSNILRFIRNFSQHAGESMPENTFRKYFPENYRNKQTFVQNMVVNIPTLLVYSWCLEKRVDLNETLQPICYEFVVMLRHSLEKYSKDKRLGTFTTVKNNQTVVFEVLHCDVHFYNRFAGMEIRIKTENGESFLEVERSHYKESIKFKVDTPQTIAQYKISFGAHNMHENAGLENFIFVQNSNLNDVIKELDAGAPYSPNIQVGVETTPLLRSYILETAKLQINGAQVQLKNIANAGSEFFETIEYNDWKRLLFNEPLEIFTNGGIDNLPVQENNLLEVSRIIQSKRKMHVLTLNTAVYRTNILKNLHYELGRANYISLFVPVVRLSTISEPSSLKHKIIEYFGKNEMEKILIEQVFSTGFPETVILMDGIDQIPIGEFLIFMIEIQNLNVKIIATSPVFSDQLKQADAHEISLGKSCSINTNG